MKCIRPWLRVILMVCAWTGCVEDFDTTRKAHREATLGDHVFEVLCNRLAIRENPHDVSGKSTRAMCQGTGIPAAGASARLKTLYNNRPRLVQALDATFGIDSTGTNAVLQDPRLATDMRTLLNQMLPLYDSGLVESHSAALDPWLTQLRTSGVADTLAARSTRQWYNQSVVQNANHEFVVPTAALPVLMRFDQLVELGVAFDQVFGEGAPHAGVFANWLTQVQAELRDYSPQQVSGFLLDYLLREDPALGNQTPPLYSVLRTRDGDAEMLDERADLTPDVPQTAPFGDANSAWNSAYTRDAFGRLRDDGSLLYAYQDLNKTPLAATLRQVQMWMGKLAALGTPAAPTLAASPGVAAGTGRATLLDGITWLDAILQPGGPASFDTTQLADQGVDSPVLDAAAAGSWLADQERIKTALSTVRFLWAEDETDIAHFIQLFANMGRRMDQNDLAGAALRPGNTLIDDLIGVMQKVEEHPGLLDRILEALADPQTAKLGPLFALQMSTLDAIDYDHTDFRSSATTGDFVTPVNRSVADVLGNESVFQRLLYLVHDSHGLTILNNHTEEFPYDPGELFKIDDAALFYLRSIIGKARMSICSRFTQELIFDFGAAKYLGTELGMLMPSPDDYNYRYYIEYAMGLTGLTPQEPTAEEVDYCATVYNPEEPGYPHKAYSYSVTPQAAARMLFFDPSELQAWNKQIKKQAPGYAIMYPPATLYDEPSINGVPFRQLHGKTLFAWEKYGFHEGITPLLTAFAQPDPGATEGNEALFLELLEVLHKHWSTRQSDRTQSVDPNVHGTFAAQTGMSQFEPLASFALHDPQNPNLAALSLTANVLQFLFNPPASASASEDDGGYIEDVTDDGFPDAEAPVEEGELLTPMDDDPLGGIESLAGAMLGVQPGATGGYVDPVTLLGRPDPVLLMTDGVTPIAHPSPAHVLTRLMHHVAAQTDSLEAQRPGMGTVFGALLDTFSELDATQTRLANRETHALVSGLLEYVQVNVGDMGKNLRGDTNALLGNPALEASLRMMTTFNSADPEAGALVQALVTHLVSDAQRPALLSAIAQSLYTAADSKVDLTPLAHLAANAMDYPGGVLPMTLKLSSAVHRVDTAGALPRLMANMGRPLPNPDNAKVMAAAPIDVFIDVFQQVNRVTPTDTAALTAGDHGAVIEALAGFMQDDKRGFARLLDIIKHRHGN